MEARRSHERRGERNVVENLATKYTTLTGVLEFLTTNHDFYTANKLVKKSLDTGVKRSGNLLKQSYGQMSSSSGAKLVELKEGKVVFSLYALICVTAVTAVGLFFSRRFNDGRHSKSN